MSSSDEENEKKPSMFEDKDEPLIHQLEVEHKHPSDMPMKNMFIVFVVVIIAGIASGFALSYFTKTGVSTKLTAKKDDATESISNEKCKDTMSDEAKKIFIDTAEGTLREGGHESGEGTFHLERSKEDESQTAYLTTSTLDLTPYIGKKIRVYAQTYASQNVGWLMDVGCVEPL